MLGVEQILLVGELGAAVFRRLLGDRLGFVLAGERRIELLEPQLFARFDAELLLIIQGFEPPSPVAAVVDCVYSQRRDF